MYNIAEYSIIIDTEYTVRLLIVCVTNKLKISLSQDLAAYVSIVLCNFLFRINN